MCVLTDVSSHTVNVVLGTIAVAFHIWLAIEQGWRRLVNTLLDVGFRFVFTPEYILNEQASVTVISPSLQFEAACTLTNFTSGTSEEVEAVVQAGAVPVFIAFLQLPHQNICEQAVWAFGNIIGNGPVRRDVCIAHGVVSSLLKLLSPTIPVSFLYSVTSAIVNLCQFRFPPLPMEAVVEILPALCELVHHQDTNIVTPKTVGNLVSSTDAQTQAVLDCDALSHFGALLSLSNEQIIEEALVFLSNITAGNHQQIQAVLDAGLIPEIIRHLCTGSYTIQKHALWAVTNPISVIGTKQIVTELVKNNVIELRCNFLETNDTIIVQLCLEGINNILKISGEDYPRIAKMIETCCGVAKIKMLQNSDIGQICMMACETEQYFSDNLLQKFQECTLGAINKLLLALSQSSPPPNEI